MGTVKVQFSLQTVHEKLEGGSSDQRGEQKRASLRRSIGSQYQSRIRSSKTDLAQYKMLSREMHAQVSRAGPFSRSAGPATRYCILKDGSRRLQESQRVALETEVQGADIFQSLIGQREQMEYTRSACKQVTLIALQLKSADNSIDRASGTLKKMIRRMYQHSFYTIITIIDLVLLTGILLWVKLL
ncbi:hypothetical protein BC826DRAFT_1095723 [Russula brevipes]|nr:hypothetical protein BC826DRAFT_1095723 [Russula brevipes]